MSKRIGASKHGVVIRTAGGTALHVPAGARPASGGGTYMQSPPASRPETTRRKTEHDRALETQAAVERRQAAAKLASKISTAYPLRKKTR